MPALLLLMIGYDSTRGDARYVGVTYAHRADGITVYDGMETYECPADGWTAFHRHPRVSASLAEFDFGDSGYPTHMFIIDRATGGALVSSLEAARHFLDEQSTHRIPHHAPLRQSQCVFNGMIREMRTAALDVYQASLRTTVASLLPDLRFALDMGI